MNHTFLWFHIEYWFISLWVFLIIMHCGVVSLYAMLVDEFIDLSTSPEDGTVAVGGEVVDWTIGIEGWVEGETCAYAGA